MGLAALGHVGSSWIRDQAGVPRTGRWILNCWATKEVPVAYVFVLLNFAVALISFFSFFLENIEEAVAIHVATRISSAWWTAKALESFVHPSGLSSVYTGLTVEH